MVTGKPCRMQIKPTPRSLFDPKGIVGMQGKEKVVGGT